MVIRLQLPDEVVFESLASRLRPLMVEPDDVHFEKAFRALDRLMCERHEEMRWLVGEARDEWRRATDRKRPVRAYSIITVDGSYSDVDLAFAWLYGDLVHGDHEKG